MRFIFRDKMKESLPICKKPAMGEIIIFRKPAG